MSDKENKFFRDTVNTIPLLRLNLQKDGVHRVSRDGFKDGAVWLVDKGDHTLMHTTGKVADFLNPRVTATLNSPAYVGKGNKYWRVSDPEVLARFLRIFGFAQVIHGGLK